MAWFICNLDPATPAPQTPETVAVSQDQFTYGLTWTRGKQRYLRATCNNCGKKFGTCQGQARFDELKACHTNDCGPCGFLDCVDCREKPQPWVRFNAV